MSAIAQLLFLPVMRPTHVSDGEPFQVAVSLQLTAVLRGHTWQPGTRLSCDPSRQPSPVRCGAGCGAHTALGINFRSWF